LGFKLRAQPQVGKTDTVHNFMFYFRALNFVTSGHGSQTFLAKIVNILTAKDFVIVLP